MDIQFNLINSIRRKFNFFYLFTFPVKLIYQNIIVLKELFRF